MPVYELNFRETLRIERERRDMTQPRLAEALGLSPSTIARWETEGAPSASATTLAGIVLDETKSQDIRDLASRLLAALRTTPTPAQ